MKKILLLVLLTISTSVHAEWVKIAEDRSSDPPRWSDVFLDPTTIRPNGDWIGVSVLRNYILVQDSGSYLSSWVRFEISCKFKTWRSAGSKVFNGDMGKGPVIMDSSPSLEVKPWKYFEDFEYDRGYLEGLLKVFKYVCR